SVLSLIGSVCWLFSGQELLKSIPTRRSSDLEGAGVGNEGVCSEAPDTAQDPCLGRGPRGVVQFTPPVTHVGQSRRHQFGAVEEGDRKSTRLNSSHVSTSYAVHCWNKNRSDSC